MIDVIGIGNAIVDVLASVDDALLERYELTKGAMTLVDEPTAQALHRALPETVGCSGGSAANTMAGVASLGAVRPTSGRSGTTTSGPSSGTTSAPPGSSSGPRRDPAVRRPDAAWSS